jgi:hypothetical protein
VTTATQDLLIRGRAAVELVDSSGALFRKSDVSLHIAVARCGYRVTEHVPDLGWAVTWAWRPTVAGARRKFHQRLGELVEQGYVPKAEEDE